MYRLALVCVVIVTLAASAVAQNAKPWTEWTKEDIEKTLNGSPWGQTQSETDTGNMVWASPVNERPNSPLGSTGSSTPSQPITYNYRIRLFSAKPIREAFARQVMLGNPKIVAGQLQNFVDGDYSEVIVVAVTYDGADRRYTGIIGQAFDSAIKATVKNKTYLERKDGRKIEIQDYAPPSSDGTGAKFVFPRIVDGKPFVTADDEFVRFVTDLGRGVKVSWKFKLSDMVINGKLEL